jgi:hypothetical protein
MDSTTLNVKGRGGRGERENEGGGRRRMKEGGGE